MRRRNEDLFTLLDIQEAIRRDFAIRTVVWFLTRDKEGQWTASRATPQPDWS